MKQQQLDQDGLASSYLLLTMLTPLVAYSIYSQLKGKPHFACKCQACSSRKPRKNVIQIIFSILLYLLTAYLCRNILTIKIKQENAEFDPFQILNVTPDSSLPEIKKNYRKMLKFFNKRLNKSASKEEANEGIKNLNKAFGILKNPESFNDWISNGFTKELHIALPSFILNFSSPILVLYGILIAAAIPCYFLIKYLNFKKIGFSGSAYLSNEKFYDNVPNFSKVPNIAIHQCIFLMGSSVELTTRKWREELPPENSKILEIEYAIPVMSEKPGYQRILMYLTRRIKDADDRIYIGEACRMLVKSYKKIAHIRGKTKLFEALLTLEKMINQAVFNPDFYQLQYPGLSRADVFQSVILNEAVKKSLLNDEKLINKCLQGTELKIALNVLNNIPRLAISEFKAFTIDTTISNCQFNDEDIPVIQKEGELFIIPKDSIPYVQFKLISEKSYPVCHTPFLQEMIPNNWLVYLKVNGQLEGDIIYFDSFKGTKKVKLSIPFGNGKQDVKVFVVSNGYFANDCMASLTIKYI